MKKLIIFVFLLACVYMQAQEDMPRHEVSVSYSYPHLFHYSVKDDGAHWNIKEFGPLSSEYYYHFGELGLGVQGVFNFGLRYRF